MSGPIDGILIVGTRLQIPALRAFVRQLIGKMRRLILQNTISDEDGGVVVEYQERAIKKPCMLIYDGFETHESLRVTTPCLACNTKAKIWKSEGDERGP